MRVKSGVAASGLGLLLLLAACASDRVPEPTPPVQPPQGELEQQPPAEVRVGLLLPMTGPAAGLARDMQDAAQMALFDVGENDLILLPRDTRGTPEGARQAAQQVIEEGAVVILGPLFNQAVSAVSPLAAPAGVRVLAFSNVASAATEGTFLLGFRPEEQVARVVRYALENVTPQTQEAALLGGGSDQDALSQFDPRPVRIAGLAPDDAYGATAMEALRRAVRDGGGDLGQTLFYAPNQADPSAVVRQIAAYDQRKAALERERARLEQLPDDPQARQALQRLETLDTLGPPPFDAIMIADGGDRLRSVASLLTFFDVDPGSVRFLGTMRWQDDPRVLAEAALQQGWFAASAPDGLARFGTSFEAAYGRRPQQPALAALAYDATALAVIVARDMHDPRFESATLTNAQGFGAGATGLFRLRPDGLADHGLAILEVANGAARMIDPPPQSFTDQLAAR
jgi:ABC-type branched-subunit amino acid transport system substrate-binding protein